MRCQRWLVSGAGWHWRDCSLGPRSHRLGMYVHWLRRLETQQDGRVARRNRLASHQCPRAQRESETATRDAHTEKPSSSAPHTRIDRRGRPLVPENFKKGPRQDRTRAHHQHSTTGPARQSTPGEGSPAVIDSVSFRFEPAPPKAVTGGERCPNLSTENTCSATHTAEYSTANLLPYGPLSPPDRDDE